MPISHIPPILYGTYLQFCLLIAVQMVYLRWSANSLPRYLCFIISVLATSLALLVLRKDDDYVQSEISSQPHDPHRSEGPPEAGLNAALGDSFNTHSRTNIRASEAVTATVDCGKVGAANGRRKEPSVVIPRGTPSMRQGNGRGPHSPALSLAHPPTSDPSAYYSTRATAIW